MGPLSPPLGKGNFFCRCWGNGARTSEMSISSSPRATAGVQLSIVAERVLLFGLNAVRAHGHDHARHGPARLPSTSETLVRYRDGAIKANRPPNPRQARDRDGGVLLGPGGGLPGHVWWALVNPSSYVRCWGQSGLRFRGTGGLLVASIGHWGSPG